MYTTKEAILDRLLQLGGEIEASTWAYHFTGVYSGYYITVKPIKKANSFHYVFNLRCQEEDGTSSILLDSTTVPDLKLVLDEAKAMIMHDGGKS